MISIVKRVAKEQGADPNDLLPVYEQLANAAVKSNGDRFDTRAFIEAAIGFVTETGAVITPEVVKGLSSR